MHFARTAVELEGQNFIAVYKLHGGCLPALNIPFCLLRTQVKRKAQAVLGDHHRHIALLFMRFISRVDQLHAVAMIEFTRFMVINVGQEG